MRAAAGDSQSSLSCTTDDSFFELKNIFVAVEMQGLHEQGSVHRQAISS
jgi:hypothetical protein